MILKRSINALAVIISYVISRMLSRPFHAGMPLAISIEPTTSCNLSCPECPTGTGSLTRPMGSMSFQEFRSIIDEFTPFLTYLTLYFQGEPFLNRELPDMIRYARSKKIYVATSTNGHFLTDEIAPEIIRSGLNKIIISLDGADAYSYSKYRTGGDFHKVILGIRSLVAMKKGLGKPNPKVVLQCLYLRSNQHQIQEIRTLAKVLGADKLEFKTAHFNDFGINNSLIPDNPKHTRYHNVTETPKLQNSCFRSWAGCVITWNGIVAPCCFDKDAGYRMGNLKQEDFKTIWRGTKYNEFRTSILTGRSELEICRNCTQRW